jgi:hypothetical protein
MTSRESYRIRTENEMEPNVYEMEPNVYGCWQMHRGRPRVGLWGVDGEQTLKAVQQFIERPEGLKAFLSQCWT